METCFKVGDVRCSVESMGDGGSRVYEVNISVPIGIDLQIATEFQRTAVTFRERSENETSILRDVLNAVLLALYNTDRLHDNGAR